MPGEPRKPITPLGAEEETGWRKSISRRLRALRDHGPGSGNLDVLRAAVSRRTESNWGRIPQMTRHRIGAGIIVALVAALLWFVLIPAAPCGFPGGDSCPPEDDAIGLVPDDALAYAHLDIDPDSEQFAAATDISARAPLLSRLGIGAVTDASGVTADFSSQIKPWAGGEMALALLPSGTSVERVVMIEAVDTDAADQFASELLGPKQSTADVDGSEVSIGKRGSSWAIEDGFLLLGQTDGVSAILAAKGDGSHLDGAEGTAVLEELPDQRLAYAYLSADGARALGSVPAFEPLDTFIDSGATDAAAAALTVDADGVHLSMRSDLDSDRVEVSPGFFAALPSFTPSLTADIGDGTLAYLGLGDPAASVEALLEQAKTSSPGLVSAFRGASKDLEKQAGINVGKDLLPLLGSEAAFSVQPVAAAPTDSATVPGTIIDSATPYASLIAEGIDSDAAARALAELQESVANALRSEEGESGQVPVFETIQVAGLQAQLLSVSPAINLTYATYDDRLVIVTDSLGIEQARSTEDGLDTSAAFQRATAGFPDSVSLLVYFDLGGLLSLGEQVGLAEDPAYTAFAPDLRSLTSAALAVDGSNEAIRTDLQVAVGDGQVPEIDAPSVSGE